MRFGKKLCEIGWTKKMHAMLCSLISGLTEYCSHSETQECRTQDMKECRGQKAESCSKDAFHFQYNKYSKNAYNLRIQALVETDLLGLWHLQFLKNIMGYQLAKQYKMLSKIVFLFFSRELKVYIVGASITEN